MPGDRIVLAGDDDGVATRLVRASASLGDLDIGRFALIGGLAVMGRLSAVHRATHDVDTVAEARVPTAVEVIAASVGASGPSHPNRVYVDGVKIDVIDTEAFDYEDLDGVDPDGRMFVISHRWALDTASEARIVAGRASSSILLATAPALVAMKAGAIAGGRRREPHKRASDLYDLYRLVLAHDRSGAVSEALAEAPFGLGRLVGDSLRINVIDEPERAARSLHKGGPEMRAVTADHLSDVLGPLVEHLKR